jgi:hypothetical protein
MGNKDLSSRSSAPLRRLIVLVLDPPALFAIAALISSVSALVWAVRRKP